MKINRENYFGAKGGGPRPAFAENPHPDIGKLYAVSYSIFVRHTL